MADAFAWAEAVQRATRATAGATVPPVAFRIAIDHGDMHSPIEMFTAPGQHCGPVAGPGAAGVIALTQYALQHLPIPSAAA